MSEIKQVIQDYVAAWNSSDSNARMLLMTKVLAENCVYVDSHLPEAIANQKFHFQFKAKNNFKRKVTNNHSIPSSFIFSTCS